MSALLIGLLPEWVFRLPFRIGATALILGAALVSCKVHDARVYREGGAAKQQEIVTASEEHGKQANAKAKKAIDAARQPGALERLRQDPATCRDCN